MLPAVALAHPATLPGLQCPSPGLRRMATSKPRAYSLALKQRPHHEAAYDAVKARMAGSGDGALARVRTFEKLLGRATPAINMTLAGCVKFLETGKWLNVYEKVALKVGASRGAAYERALKDELQEWLQPRQDLEGLLRLRRDTHYAALNLGGGGPDYGDWCVRLAGRIPIQFATAFSGDPLRWVFDDDGNQVLTKPEVLERFATHDDRSALTAVHNEDTLCAAAIIDEGTLRNLLEDRETLIEVHIHGKVSSEHAVEIGVRRTVFEKLARLCLDYDDATSKGKRAKRFRNVRPYKKLLKLVDENDTILIKQEGA